MRERIFFVLRVSLVACFMLPILAGQSYAQFTGTSGPIVVGSTGTYKYTGVAVMPRWERNGASTVLAEWQDGSTYNIQVQWTTTPQNSFIAFFDGSTQKGIANVIIYDPVPAPPVVSSVSSRCNTGTLTLNASQIYTYQVVFWYAAASGGSPLNSGTSYTTPSLSTTTTFYAATMVPYNGAYSARVPVTAFVGPPAAPTANNVSFCASTSTQVNATPPPNATTIKWYSAASGGSLLATSNTFTTPVLTANTTYYAASFNASTNCEGTQRTPVAVSIENVPIATATGNARFGSGTLILTGTGALTGGTYKWYNSAGTLLATAPTYVTPVLSATTNSYMRVKAVSAAGCESPFSLIHVSVYAKPVITAPTSFIVMNKSVTMDAGVGYDSYQWKNSSGVVVGNARTLSTNIKGSYTVTVTKGGLSDTANPFELKGQLDGQNVNYIVTNTILKDSVIDVASIEGLTVDQRSQSIQYFDGLGRPLETIIAQGSPSKKDVIQPVVYDAFNRQHREYLPITYGQDGRFKTITYDVSGNYSGIAANFYSNNSSGMIAQDQRPFSETVFEISPLNRPLKSFGSGKDWFDRSKAVETGYLYNVDGATDGKEKIIVWKVSGNMPTRDTTVISGSGKGYFPSSSLTVNVVKDEQGHESREYKDKLGRLLLKKMYVKGVKAKFNTAGNWTETYYVYDDFNQLRFVLQPELSKKLSVSGKLNPTATDLHDFAFCYRFDASRRMIMKKAPGSDSVLMVYDKRDRLVLSQDGIQRMSKQWSFTKYDALNRPIITGIYTHATMVSQFTMAGQISATNFFESYNGTAATHGYTNVVWPTSGLTVLTVTYYDSYGFKTLIGSAAYNYSNSEIEGQPGSENNIVVGKMTGTKVIVLGTTTYLWSTNYYDDKYRIIQVVSGHQKGKTVTTSLFDFSGQVISARRSITTNNVTTSIRETFSYDHASRLKFATHSVDGDTAVVLLANQYNEIGQLVDKKLHCVNGSGNDAKQSIDYRYNIRGWLTNINDADVGAIASGDNSVDYFGMRLAYNDTINGLPTSGNFNGNISAVKWSKGNGGPVKKHAYAYVYDSLNRLMTANHYDLQKDETVWEWKSNNNGFGEELSYDLNGNIRSLVRKGFSGTSMDQLAYGYSGNQLMYVNDAADATKGFVNGNTGANDYSYDVNGNLTSDRNKGLTDVAAIKYNHLNLPVEVIKGTEKVRYTYDATGRKLAQEVFNGNNVLVKRTDYIGEMIYENDVLQFILHPEGRVLPKGSDWEYQYFLKDHLGNVRIAFTARPKQATTAFANFETATNPEFENYTRHDFDLVEHTDAANVSTHTQKLNGYGNGRVGVARSYTVMPGDEISVKAWAKYMNLSTSASPAGLINSLSSAFGVSSSSTGDERILYDALESYSLSVVGGDHEDDDDTAPKVFATILFFDKDYNFLDAAFDQISTVGAQTSSTVKGPHDLIEISAKAPEAGYAYVFLSNEHYNHVDVYFDDVTFAIKPSAIESVNDYYPFGLTYNSYSRESSTKQNFLYNGKEKQDELDLGWYDYGARMYMSDIGRWGVVDALSEISRRHSPYAYVFNNPMRFIDPDGNAAMDPGDKFKTEKDAATDFAMLYNDNSIADNKEYATKIYKVTDKESGETHYTYNVPNKGFEDFTTYYPNVMQDGEVVARAHTHGADPPVAAVDEFSDTDIENAKDLGLNSYVATPNGSLLQYDVSSDKISTVSESIPSDENHHAKNGRKNNINSKDLPKDEPVRGVGSYILDNIILPLMKGASAIKN
ncbi:Ig-like domain-containing protein [Pseudochryseolinea flava]|uniref:Ig-like domain-containing protein n=1 Tax=Pseudochryseolinea flava TaxID=2059302 RepID=UPI001402B6A3|nr:DUF6443 domain-containing protein [Pseudochryseolinea flava]